jgi:hypothetical protein
VRAGERREVTTWVVRIGQQHLCRHRVIIFFHRSVQHTEQYLRLFSGYIGRGGPLHIRRFQRLSASHIELEEPLSVVGAGAAASGELLHQKVPERRAHFETERRHVLELGELPH